MSDPLMILMLLAIIIVEYFLLGYPMKEIGTDVLIFVIVYQGGCGRFLGPHPANPRLLR